jgi:alpha-beta hydrolase superfamily lysophospholipase
LRSSGLERLTERVYSDARHELLNETNRDQVSDDLLDWLESQLAAPRL